MKTRRQAYWIAILCCGFAVGCGARSELDEGDWIADGGGSSVAGQGGNSSVAGAGAGGTGAVSGAGAGGTGAVAGAGAGGTGAVSGAGAGGTGAVAGAGAGGTGAVSGAGAGGTGGTGGTGGATGGTGGVAGGGGTSEIVDLCVSSASTACDKCLCESCGSQLDTCFGDVGCAFIFACVAQTQCSGLSCYRNATCRRIIDQFGGLSGAAVREVFALGSCSLTSQRSCGCN